MHPTVAANAQHRLDNATGKWTRVKAGVYENYDGWKITKTPDGYRWQVLNPQGDVVTKHSEPTLTWAKYEADKLIAAATQAAAEQAPAAEVVESAATVDEQPVAAGSKSYTVETRPSVERDQAWTCEGRYRTPKAAARNAERIASNRTACDVRVIVPGPERGDVLEVVGYRAGEEPASVPGGQSAAEPAPSADRTPRQLAGDAAETCRDALHFHLYADDSPRGTEKHVNAHEAERDGHQPCATCGLAITPAEGTKTGFTHVDADTFIGFWPAHDATSAPVAIDTQLSDLYVAAAKARQKHAAAAERARHLVGERKVYRGRHRVWATTDAEALVNLQCDKAAGTLASRDVAAADRALKMAADAETEEAAANEQAKPLDALYDQHRWSRFFTVPGGHIHSGLRCQGGTIRVRTLLEWNPGLSGRTEADAVKELGPILCTHCFPSAPTEWKQDPNAKPADPDQCTSVELTEEQRKSINWARVYKYVRCECTADVSVTSTGKKRKHKRGDRAKK